MGRSPMTARFYLRYSAKECNVDSVDKSDALFVVDQVGVVGNTLRQGTINPSKAVFDAIVHTNIVYFSFKFISNDCIMEFMSSC